MATEEIIYELKDGIATISLNRPDKMNALTTPMYENLQRRFEEIKKQDEVKAVIITGNGPAFCAGSDAETRLLARIENGQVMPLEKTRADLLNSVMLKFAPSLYHIGKPTIAAVNGIAAGAGLSIAMLCDIRLASETARFRAAWLNIGLIPDLGATYLLPRLVGTDRALQIFLTGETMNAAGAKAINLVTEIVPADNLMSRAKEMAARFAHGPSVAIELTKRAVYLGLVNDLPSQLIFENYAQNICFSSLDFQEGVTAFREKRAARFLGM